MIKETYERRTMEALIYLSVPILVLFGLWVASKLYPGDRWADRRRKNG